MPEIKIQHVVSSSSEDKNHPAENLLKPEGTFKWKCAGPGAKSAVVVLQLDRASQISSIDIGNEGSGFVEVLVGKSTAAADTDYQVILVASSFMTPLESRNGTNRNSVRMFGLDTLSRAVTDKKWDRVKIVCTQPFCKTSSYGLSFIKLHAPAEGKEAEKTPTQKTLGAFKLKTAEGGDMKVGALFAKRNETVEQPHLKGAAAARAASKMADEMRTSSSDVKREEKIHTPPPAKSSPAKRKHDVSSDEEVPVMPVKTPLRKQSSSLTSTISSSSRDEAAPPLKRTKSEPPKASPAKAFHKVMEKVVFVMSGYQNPYRGELREKALEMGAKYRPDWGRGCTHLICAFDNTPKYQQVEGRGRIVNKQWIVDSYKQKKLLPWRKYRVGDADTPDESSDEDEASALPPHNPARQGSSSKKPVTPKSPPRKKSTKMDVDDMYGGDTDSGEDTDDEIRRAKEKVARHEAAVAKSPGRKCDVDPYCGSTDEDDDTPPGTVARDDGDDSADSGLPDLPDFLSDKHFFLYGEIPAPERRLLGRYIAAYDGCLEEYMSNTVKYVVTAAKWDDNFNEALSENPNLVFVKPQWLHMCHDKGKLMPYQPYIVVPT
ncbi:DNA repair protein XRCC1-like isoform X2 [Haliotis rufescens]|uniref:DNA repair protein XRCC1-like isoform X1 n=1 Tax=Haliotis rufescens TaxID=6454 RepID=UPI00201F9DD3|nr:DNA repair protein XRCC1-like isoform X1 [Haliotis rufescens]XP_048238747.1 DNA repair protein XRCC1-like isoform X2 [Haliotis rufescens]